MMMMMMMGEFGSQWSFPMIAEDFKQGPWHPTYLLCQEIGQFSVHIMTFGLRLQGEHQSGRLMCNVHTHSPWCLDTHLEPQSWDSW